MLPLWRPLTLWSANAAGNCGSATSGRPLLQVSVQVAEMSRGWRRSSARACEGTICAWGVPPQASVLAVHASFLPSPNSLADHLHPPPTLHPSTPPLHSAAGKAIYIVEYAGDPPAFKSSAGCSGQASLNAYTIHKTVAVKHSPWTSCA